MALFDKFENTVGRMKQDKVTNEILSKKAMLEKSAGQEIGLLRNRINEQYCLLGEVTYNQLSSLEADSVTAEGVNKFLSVITGLFSEIKVKEEKLTELLKRCDDELEMLSPGSSASSAFKCAKCGDAYTQGVDIFCKSCGNKLG